MNTRLVITGMGAITPIGLDVHSYWHNLIKSECGIDYITKFDAAGLPTRIAAEIRNFDPEDYMPRTVARSTAPFMQYAYAAACQAINQSGLDSMPAPARTGICMGTAMAGVDEISSCEGGYLASSTGKVSPHFVPKVIGNMAAAHLAIKYGFHGPGFTLNTACSAGGDAIMAAAMLIRAGETDAVVVMGGESVLCPTVVSSLSQAKALSRRNDNPQAASRPFDLKRDGFVIGEGGGAIVIESESRAKKRGARILALLAGWGNSLDAYHITAPDPSGNGAAACMAAALERAGLKAADIDYVNAHGTSTLLGDKAETIAMKKVFGNRSSAPPVSSTKGATGHLMGAGGLTELIACVKSIEENLMPPTINLENVDPDCDLDYIPNIARKKNVNVAMSNSLGFGGQNSSIIIARYDGQE